MFFTRTREELPLNPFDSILRLWKLIMPSCVTLGTSDRCSKSDVYTATNGITGGLIKWLISFAPYGIQEMRYLAFL